MQGGPEEGRADEHILRHAQLHRARDAARRKLRLQRRLVGARRPLLRDDGGQVALRDQREPGRESRPQHGGPLVPDHFGEADPHTAQLVRQGQLRAQGKKGQSP